MYFISSLISPLFLLIIVVLAIVFYKKRSNKENLLKNISKKIASGELSRQEVIDQIDNYSIEKGAERKRIPLETFLYIIGGVIVLIGVYLFISQVWVDIEILGRIMISLVFGLFITFLGSMLYIKKPENKIGSIFHTIGGIVVIVGIAVTIYELYEINIINSLFGPALVFGISFVFYLLLNLIHKKPILTSFSILHGTIFVYLLFWAIVEDRGLDYVKLGNYLAIVIGSSYFLLAEAFQKNWNKNLSNILYLLSPVSFLGGMFTLATVSGFWELIYYFVLFAIIALAVYLKNYIILVITTAFFVVYSFYPFFGLTTHHLDFHIYLIMLVGAGYLIISYFYQKYLEEILIHSFHFIGTSAFLLVSFTKIINSVPWQLIYFFLLLITFYLATYLKSSVILTISTIFFISYISYLTGTHFADSLGWPVSLIILGFLFIGLAFLSFKFNEKYIEDKEG